MVVAARWGAGGCSTIRAPFILILGDGNRRDERIRIAFQKKLLFDRKLAENGSEYCGQIPLKAVESFSWLISRIDVFATFVILTVGEPAPAPAAGGAPAPNSDYRRYRISSREMSFDGS